MTADIRQHQCTNINKLGNRSWLNNEEFWPVLKLWLLTQKTKQKNINYSKIKDMGLLSTQTMNSFLLLLLFIIRTDTQWKWKSVHNYFFFRLLPAAVGEHFFFLPNKQHSLLLNYFRVFFYNIHEFSLQLSSIASSGNPCSNIFEPVFQPSKSFTHLHNTPTCFSHLTTKQNFTRLFWKVSFLTLTIKNVNIFSSDDTS